MHWGNFLRIHYQLQDKLSRKIINPNVLPVAYLFANIAVAPGAGPRNAMNCKNAGLGYRKPVLDARAAPGLTYA